MDINLTAEGRKEFIGNGPGSDYTLGSNVSGYDASTSYVDENGDPIDPTIPKPMRMAALRIKRLIWKYLAE